jgi:hypothetical protein
VAGLHLVLIDALLALVLVYLLGQVTYRVTRFVILDSLIERWRERFYEWTLSPLNETERSCVIDVHEDWPLRKLPWWRRKLYQLFSCPFCISVWVAGGAVALTIWLVDGVPMPAWVWLGASAHGLEVYTRIDAED